MSTWEEFSGFLRDLQEDLKGAYASRPEADWAKERLSQLERLDGQEGEWWLEEAHRAWEALGTTENRLAAQRLLLNAAMEVHEETLKRLGLSQENKRRKSRLRALQKAHKQAEDAGKQLIAALEAYGQAVREVLESRAAIPSFGSFKSPEESPETFEQTAKTTFNWLPKVLLCVAQGRDVVKQLQQLGDYAPRATDLGQQRGRQERKEVNTAIQGLESIFLARGLPRYKALEYAHCLLHLTGIWPDPSPSGLTAKAYQLQPRPKN